MAYARAGILLLLLIACLAAGCDSHGPAEVPPSPVVPTAPPEATLPPAVTAVIEDATPAVTTAVPTTLSVRGDLPPVRLTLPFNSSGNEHVVTLALDPAAFAGLDRREVACPLSSWHAGDEERLASYYAVIFKDPDLDVLYTPLLSELRHIQRMEGLNDDEYLELMVHFVQSIPYDPDAPVCPRNPLQVVLDGKGDCDEKSLLLLGLLYREGYDASILIFPAKHHATAGIRIGLSSNPSFRVFDLRGRKYVYIETTRPAFIGLYPDEFETEDPVIIPTGNGTRTYRAINDVMHIVSTQKRMEEKLIWYSDTGTGMLAEINTLEGKLGTGTAYSTQEEFDSDYARYTSLINRYNQYVREFITIRDVYLYIINHQDDREGVDGRIENSKVENLL